MTDKWIVVEGSPPSSKGYFYFAEELRLEFAHVGADIREVVMGYKRKPEPQDDIVVGDVLDANTAKRISEALENQELEMDSTWHKKEDGSWELIETSVVEKKK